MKRIYQALATIFTVALLSGTAALADNVGVVDMQEVSQRYTKAQSVAEQIKTKEEELQKLRDSLAGQLKAGEKLSATEKKSLEEKLNKQFAEKFKEYREWTLSKEQEIREDFEKAVQVVAGTTKLDVILPKQSVLQGGRDVTGDVLKVLNGAH